MYKDYHVVGNMDLEMFKQEVARLLNEGWELAGGISTCVYFEHRLFYTQAMIKTYMPDE